MLLVGILIGPHILNLMSRGMMMASRDFRKIALIVRLLRDDEHFLAEPSMILTATLLGLEGAFSSYSPASCKPRQNSTTSRSSSAGPLRPIVTHKSSSVTKIFETYCVKAMMYRNVTGVALKTNVWSI
jgi:hypothetical protein